MWHGLSTKASPSFLGADKFAVAYYELCHIKSRNIFLMEAVKHEFNSFSMKPKIKQM